MKIIGISFLVVFLLGMCPATPSAQERFSPIEVKSVNGISYITGGIGFDEREALSRMGRDYSLKLVFAAKGGAYKAMVKVTIKKSKGRTVFTAVSRGPWLYADVPSGDYKILADSKGTTIEKNAEVPSAGQTELKFYW